MKEIAKIYKEALDKKARIIKKLEPLRVKEAGLVDQLTPIEAELREIRREIAKIEVDEDLRGVSRTIAALAPAQKKLLAEAGGMGVKEP